MATPPEPTTLAVADAAALRHGIATFVQQSRDAIQHDPDLVNRHNHLVTYLVVMLQITTPLREVSHPLGRFGSVDLERGWVMVDEKGGERLAVLPTLVCRQLARYHDHLTYLSRRLSRQPKWLPLALRIHRTLQGHATLPYLFYLQDGGIEPLRPGAWRARVANQLPYPGNLGRKRWASEAEVGDDSLLLYGLGHAQWRPVLGEGSPFGTLTQQSARLRAELDRLTEGLGFEVLEGVTHHHTQPNELEGMSPAQIHQADTLIVPDWSERLHARAERQQSLHELAAAIEQQLPPPPLPERSESRMHAYLAELDQVIETTALHHRCSPLALSSLLQPRLDALVRQGYIGTLRLRRKAVVPLPPERYPERFIEQLITYRQVTARWGEWLHQSAPPTDTPPDLAQRLAEITLSAILFGHLLDPAALESLPQALTRLTILAPEWVAIEWGEEGGRVAAEEKGSTPPPLPTPPPLATESPRLRWFPDPLTLGLIGGLKRHYREEAIRSYPSTAYRKALRTLGATLFGESLSVRALLTRLRSLSRVVLVANTPGWLQGQARQNRPLASLPLSVLVRLESGQPLRTAASAPSRVEPPRAHPRPSLLPDPAIPPDLRLSRARAWVKQIRQQLSQRKQEAPPIGYQARSPSLRRQAQRDFEQFLRDQPDCSPLMRLLIGWGIHLAQAGTRRKAQLAYSTLQSYWPQVANRLVEHAYNQSLLTFGGEAFTALYSQILAPVTPPQPPNERRDLLGRLREFHHYLVDEWSIDEVDWLEVIHASGIEEAELTIDANLVTPTEYQRALTLLKQTELPEEEQLLTSWLLLLGYRFGLRWSEAYTLQERDLQGDGHTEPLLLRLRPHQHRDNKSRAASRLIPALGPLSERELALLQAVRERVQLLAGEDRQNPLTLTMSHPQRELLPAYRLMTLSHQALRQASGDPHLRFHHLRHGYFMRALLNDGLAAAPPADSPALDRLRQCLLSDLPAGYRVPLWQESPPSKRLSAISVSMGHAALTTSLSHYGHLLEFLLTGYTVTPPLTGVALAALRGTALNQHRVEWHRLTQREGELTIGAGLSRLNARRFKPNDRSVWVVPPRAVATQLHLVHPVDRRFTLAEVAQWLGWLSAPDRDPDRLAETLQIDPALLQRLLPLLRAHEQQSGDRFGQIFWRDQPQLTELPPLKRAVKGHTLAPQVIALAEQIQQMSATDPTLEPLLQTGYAVWCACYHTGREPLLCPESGAIQTLVQLTQRLQWFQAATCAVPRRLGEPLFQTLQQATGLPVEWVDRLPLARQKSLGQRLVRIGLRLVMQWKDQPITPLTLGRALLLDQSARAIQKR